MHSASRGPTRLPKPLRICTTGSTPDRTACHGGRCVDPRCSEVRPAFCEPECELDSDCTATVACNQVACRDGVCLETPDDALCPGATCDPITGCTGPACPTLDCTNPGCAGQPCNDGLPCTGAGACGAGACQPGPYLGDHVAPNPADGTLRCCGGNLVNIYADAGHCGGCNLACGSGVCGAVGFLAVCTCTTNAQCPTGVCSGIDSVCSCDPAFGGVCPYTCYDRDPGADICTY